MPFPWATVGSLHLTLISAKGSEKNKVAILGVEAPGRQGAKTQEYLDIPSFRNTDGCFGRN
jgi:hypothetical protein